MKIFFQTLMILVVVTSAGSGLFYILNGLNKNNSVLSNNLQKTDTAQILQIKTHLLKYPKPQRIEVETLTDRLKNNVDAIKKMRVGLDQNSNIYIRIQFFTDENDQNSKLIAQFRVFDLKTDNLLKEESINLN